MGDDRRLTEILDSAEVALIEGISLAANRASRQAFSEETREIESRIALNLVLALDKLR